MKNLSDSEWEVMNVLWDGGGLTLSEINARLRAGGISWAGNTVQTFLTRLAKKGAVTVDRSGLPYRYAAAAPREEYEKEALEAFKSRVFRGSASRMVSAFVEGEKLSDEDVAALRRFIEDNFGRDEP